MAEIGKTERILNLVSYLLKERRPVPWREIAGKVVGYDDLTDPKSLERRFERDKAALKDMGVPVAYYPPGQFDTEGYMIPREACFLDRLELLPQEAALLNLVSELALRRGGASFSSDLMSALQKLRFDAPGESLRRARPVPEAGAARTGKPRKRGRPPKMRQPAERSPVPEDEDSRSAYERSLLGLELAGALREDSNLKTVTAGLLANQRLAFTYYAIGPDETRRREVDPYGLGFARGAWYLVGYDHTREGVRCFRLDRVRGAVEPLGSERAFAVPEGFRVQDHIERPPWLMSEQPPIEVTIEVGRDIAWFVEEPIARKSAEERADGSVIMKIDVRDRPAFLRWVLGHLRHVRILEPASLRRELGTVLGEISRAHEGDATAAAGGGSRRRSQTQRRRG